MPKTENSDSFTLDIIGAAGGYPYAGQACSAFLVRIAGKALLLDCGPGAIVQLSKHLRSSDLDAVVISHMHPDHMLDLVALGYGLMTEWIARRIEKPVELWLPLGGRAFFEQLCALFGHAHWSFTDDELGPGFARLRRTAAADRDWMTEVFEVREYAAGDSICAAGILIDTLAVDHIPNSAALRIDHAGRRLTYSGDTRYVPALADFAAGSDVLVAEAHFSGSHPPGGAHMTPAEAGKIAAAAKARLLLLTHLAAASDGPAALALAKTHCACPVALAAEHPTLRL